MTEEFYEHVDNFRKALEEGDAMTLWRIWAHINPHLPQPKTLTEATIIMHRARTEAETIHEDKRCYSHAWLLDHDFPSGLPDRLLPKANRLYPRVVKGVGISVNVPKLIKPVGEEVQKAMAGAVEELHADGVDLNNREKVHKLMFERREVVIQQMLGVKTIKDAQR